jgi:hypothetical protein
MIFFAMDAIEDFFSSNDPFGSTITQMYPMFAVFIRALHPFCEY